MDPGLRLKCRNSMRSDKFCEGPSGTLEYLKMEFFLLLLFLALHSQSGFAMYTSFVGYNADINPLSFLTLNTESHSCFMTVLNYYTNLHSPSVLFFLPAYNSQTYPCSTCINMRKMDISKRIFQPASLGCLKFSLKGLGYSGGN